MTLKEKTFENIVEKGENAVSPFPTMFSTLPKTSFNFSFKFILSSANAFNLDQSKILLCGKELNNRILKWSKLKAFANNKLTHSHKMTPFDALKIYSCNKQFLIFSQCFLPYMTLVFTFNAL